MRESRTFGERCKTKFSDEPRRKCLFLFEGKETEPIYFSKLKDLRDEVGISTLIDFIQIEKPRGEDWSNPKKIIDALCLDLTETPTYNTLINAMVDCLYTDAYLFRHRSKIKEFEDLLISFMKDTLRVKESDLVGNVEGTVKNTLEYFQKQWPKICNIILMHIEEMLQNYKITYERDFDILCMVVDRDRSHFLNGSLTMFWKLVKKMVSNSCSQILILNFGYFCTLTMFLNSTGRKSD